MATTTYEPIQSEVLGSAAATVTFSSIPQGYTDLVLVINGTRTTNNGDVTLRINSDTGSNYSFTRVTGNGSSVVSQRTSNDNIGYTGVLSNSVRGTITVNLLNYSSTNCYKTWLTRFAVIGDRTGAYITSWRSSSAITNIVVGCGADTFTAGSTFTLYGIANAAVATGVKATGGIITYDDTYYYHTFGASGTFTPKQSLTADYLVVAGGGGGAFGGGGAGGLRSTMGTTGGGGSLESSLSLTAQSYTITVGAGGAGGVPNTVNAAVNGSTSSISGSGLTTITSTGGGRGGMEYAGGSNGGSGGGAGRGGQWYTAGTGTANQGYAGGANNANPPYPSGGGGGAGAAAAGAGTGGTAGGVGVQITALATATGTGANSGYYAGGGGGAGDTTSGGTGRGAGGLGGGGAAGASTGTAGTTNTGGGGGGAGGEVGSGNGGAGGSGIVIIRYTKA